MMVIHADIYQTAALAAGVLVLGMFLVNRVAFLKRYCIPAAVTGGLLFALGHYMLYSADILEIVFDSTLQTVFMMAFFCSVGYMACFRELKRGGKTVIILLGITIALLFCQDLIGLLMAPMFGLNSKLGLAMGSISLVGGHGTAGSFGPFLEEEYGITGASAVALAAATYGLVMGGVLGGPLARRRVETLNLRPTQEDIKIVEDENIGSKGKEHIDNNRFLVALMIISVSIGVGTVVDRGFDALGIAVPIYIGAMVVAVIARNIAEVKHFELPSKEINTLGWICLSMFLSMALMSMKLWQLEALATPMIAILFVQTVFMILFAYFAVFRLTGSDYEGAAMTTASCGFGLGATPTAMANMTALFDKYGIAPKAYLAVPLVGSVFIDFFNVAVITLFLNII